MNPIQANGKKRPLEHRFDLEIVAETTNRNCKHKHH
jgi:hypothetical protein